MRLRNLRKHLNRGFACRFALSQLLIHSAALVDA